LHLNIKAFYEEVIVVEWHNKLRENINSIEELKQYIDMTPEEEIRFGKIIERHPMSITRYYLSLIDWNDPNDPIRKMAVPRIEELNPVGMYDTSGEQENTKMCGLQHKYNQTALILSTNKCAVYCRYCFRKRLVGLPTEEILKRFSDAVNYIQDHPEINNVLISGGDPFVLPTSVIENFLEELSVVPHLSFIRFGTRTPVTFPSRVLDDPDLVDVLKKYSMKDRRIYVVTQFNHPREITEESMEVVDRLVQSGIIINNQSILLKGINDNPFALSELQNRLVSIGVNPYYVFQCRPVKRAKAQFQVPLYRGVSIVENAKKELNGHSKRFKYIISHRTGKIEIVGVMDGRIIFKYHQAKNPDNLGKVFARRLSKDSTWLDDSFLQDLHPERMEAISDSLMNSNIN
jgi:lysine 2,3-aminomutase